MKFRLRPCIAAAFSAFFGVLFTPTPALNAQVPGIINYQGRVAVGTLNFDGSGQFKFALVDPTGTTSYWSNDGTSSAGGEPAAAVTLTVTKGRYSVLLGDASLTSMAAIPATVFTNADVRLRVWFNDGTHGSQLLTPDQRLAAVGYAMVAGSVADGSITAANLADGTITGSKIANGAIGGSQLASGLVLGGTTTGTYNGPLTGNVTGSATSFTGSLSGDVTGTQSATSIAAATVTGKSLTGFASGAGTVSATDSILSAINKLNGNDALKAPLASPAFTGTVTAPTFAGTLTGSATSFTGSLAGDVTGTQSATAIAAATVTGKLLTGFASVAGTVSASDSILTAINKLNGNDALKAPLASPTFTGTVTAPAFAGTLTGSATSFTGSLAGDVTGTQSATAIAAATVTGKAITGFVSGAGTVAATDTILSAINKLNGNVTLKASLASPTFTGTVSAATFSGPLTGDVTGNVSGSSSTFTSSLAGDVTGSRTSTVVAAVGGSTAANVHNGEVLANASSSANTVGTIVRRDASGNFSAGTITATLAAGSVTTAQLAAGAVQTNNIADGSVTSSKLASSAQVIPSGAVMAFAGATAPEGWLLCDGSLQSRATYAALFAVIGTTHGVGDGSTTFNLPDYRGRFLRGVDGTAGRDPDKTGRTAMTTGGNTGNNVGSVQNDQLFAHSHSLHGDYKQNFAFTPGGTGEYVTPTAGTGATISNTGNTSSVGGTETRPMNAYVNYLIKF